jgi:16S rRNA (guanine1207-N2)-methyltransferase
MENSSEITWSVIERLLKADVVLREQSSVWIPQPEFCASSQNVLRFLEGHKLDVWHTFRPTVLAFNRINILTDQSQSSGPYDLAICVPTRQRIESLAQIAHAWVNLKPEGCLLFACSNEQGARGYLSYLKEVFPELEAESKSKCRYALLNPSQGLHPEVLQQWIQAASAQVIPHTELVGSPGIFGWNKVDRGSELLVETLPALRGVGADLGSGYGFLSHAVLSRSPGVSAIHLVEAEFRALDCARLNLKGFEEKCHFHWQDVTKESIPQQLDWVVMNPPFHEGQATNSQLGQFFIDVAARALKPGGVLYLVANKFLAYEDILDRHFKTKNRLIEKDGFKVIHAQR